MRFPCEVAGIEDLRKVQREIGRVRLLVRSATEDLAAVIRTTAPRKSGDLIRGIVASPWEEKRAHPGEIFRQVYFDFAMNDVFVKYSKKGVRYYYPASQEFGFRVGRQNSTGSQRRVPGKFFMRNTAIEYVPKFLVSVERLVEEVTK